MSYFSQITTPREELNYLKKINDLNTQLHEKYSNRFFSDHNIQRKYETMFKPITKPLHKSLTQQEQFNNSLTRKEQQQQQQQQQQEQQQEKEKEQQGPSYSTPLHRKRKAFPTLTGKKRKVSLSTGARKKKAKKTLFSIPESEEDLGGEEEGGFHIAQFIKNPEKYGFPDKFFGITKKPGKTYDKYIFLGNTIQILGNPSNQMKIIAPANLQQILDIPSQNLWEIIVLERPSHAITHAESVQYGNILIANDFEKWLHAKRISKSKNDMLSSPKFQNIIQPALDDAKNAQQQHPGSGMYTSHSPRYYLSKTTKGRGLKKKKKEKKNSSVVEFFPANKKVLLKKFIYLLGEFHCGNTHLRNEIIPIVNYLKSQKALPVKFDTRRMNWIYD